MIIFSLSNGYIGNLCMMMGPKTVERENDQECVASMLVSVLVLGIGIGSFLSYPIVHHLYRFWLIFYSLDLWSCKDPGCKLLRIIAPDTKHWSSNF
ncbi:equilibrative nucleoside transporter 1-like [Eurytemora carolleeae]|uniref:equilibrative nucleoside transporter 1-like n=1 Tax=Eurytemora carolleeae TaxID=1294199 RepID=UPI000C7719E8|nr:equilibrative nucleoside transporter 1-like [Eurytemora carolleeae]|eukprot:XP_023342253.1 equilibrative nucleoside transporter 1-like [Eurytemora affinis]